MDCIVIYMYRGNRCSKLVHCDNGDWYTSFRAMTDYDSIISHMMIG